MDIKLYNTLTHEKDVFKPIKKDEVSIYTCGPTVYDYAHIGNMRAYIFMDNLRRMFKYNGYKTHHVMNLTDVGHLTSDADSGEDKMEKAAKREGKNPWDIAEFYINTFMKDIESLNIDKPEVITRATDNIPEMLEMVQEIVKNGYGYETSKGIYFDTSKLDKYPVLSNNKVEDQEAGARIEVDPEKRNPQDFAIWIKAPANHIMQWDSPWGRSYPGWHIECSAMGRKFLGEHFDIHTGGIDHIPIHHENEIAQDKGSFGHNPANRWMHVEFLQVDGGKMSKSLGNFYTLDILKNKGIEPLAYRLFCYSSHYRNKLNFTFDGILAAQKSLNRLRRGYLANKDGKEKISPDEIKKLENKFHEAINDDLNMPLATGIMWDIVRDERKSKDFKKLLDRFDTVFGLDLINSEKYLANNLDDIPKEIIELSQKRLQAKKEKNYKLADNIRDEIKDKGYSLKDTADGVEITKI